MRRDRKDVHNPVRWNSIKLNILGNANYNPAFPRVYKRDARLRRIAGDLISYIDDLRAIGYSMEDVWKIARRVASYFSIWAFKLPLESAG